MDQETRAKKKYKEYEDLTFPIELLHRGVEILETKGHGAFRAFCDRVQMPTQDVERCLNRFNYLHDPEFKKKIDEKWQIIKQKTGVEKPF